jgi:DNA-binding MarR family transcriptional regulator
VEDAAQEPSEPGRTQPAAGEPAPGAPGTRAPGTRGSDTGVSGTGGPGGLAFLLVQLGLYGARQFGARLAPLGLEQRQAGMLLRLAVNQGRSQQAIAEMIGVNATRMVFLVDELEKLGLVERRRNPADRRSHALYLTSAGTATVDRVRAIAAEHEAALTAGLTAGEQEQLIGLLRRIAAEQGLHPGGMPGSLPETAVNGRPAAG